MLDTGEAMPHNDGMEKRPRIDPGWVRSRVEDMRAESNDSEMAHYDEDGLYASVLQAIADGRCDGPSECAKEALKTKAISFERWCA